MISISCCDDGPGRDQGCYTIVGSSIINQPAYARLRLSILREHARALFDGTRFSNNAGVDGRWPHRGAEGLSQGSLSDGS